MGTVRRMTLPGGAELVESDPPDDERRVACRPLAAVVVRTRPRETAVTEEARVSPILPQMIYLRDIRAHSFLVLTTSGESFCLRDFSAKAGPVLEVARQSPG